MTLEGKEPAEANDPRPPPRVDFYLLNDATPEGSRLFACKLAEKVYSLGRRAFLLTPSGEEAERLDERLWTFRAGSFVPHALHRSRGAAGEPVLIGCGPPPEDSTDVLFNLTASIPPWYRSFTRIVEIVGNDPEARRGGRVRYAGYRDAGCTLRTHRLDDVPQHGAP